MNIDPARRRILRLQTVAFALLLGLLIAWAYSLQRRQLLSQVQQELTQIAHHLTFSVEYEHGAPEFDESIYLANRGDRVELGPHAVAQWLDLKGSVIRSRGRLELEPRPPATELLEFQNRPVPAYVYTLLATKGGQPIGYARVAISLVPIYSQLHRGLFSLLGIGGVLLLISCLLGWWWTGRVLRPIQAAHQELATFAGAVAHELRSPLTALRLNSESLGNRWRELPPQELELALAELSQTSLEMSQLVDDILLLSQLRRSVDPPPAVPLELQSTLRETLSSLNELANERRVSVRLFVDEPPGFDLFGDERHLRIILRNLIENAVRYTDGGGSVEVRLKSGRLTIADTGIGMSPQVVASAFEPFWRAEPSRARHLGGAGLGLAIVGALVNLHGLELSVESEAGKGSCFTLTFPRGRSSLT